MKLLVIGSEGFIGAHLMRWFAQTEKCEVVSMDVRSSARKGHIQKGCAELDSVLKLIGPFDAVINASGAADVQASISNSEHDKKLNFDNVVHILNGLKNRNPEAKLINLSSAAVYGRPTKLPILEGDDSNSEPISPYGMHKKMSESVLEEYSNSYGMKTLSLRLFSCYGIGQKKLLFWDIFKKLKIDNESVLSLFGDGNESRDYLNVTDLCRAIEVVIKSAQFDGSSLNCSSGVETSIKSIAEMAVAILKPNAEIVFTGNDRPGDPKNWKADISQLRSIGFQHKVELELGIREYYNWAVKQV